MAITTTPVVMSVREDKIWGEGWLPNKKSTVYKNFARFKADFCPIVADFCKFFESWGAVAPCPLSPTPMPVVVLKFLDVEKLSLNFLQKQAMNILEYFRLEAMRS